MSAAQYKKQEEIGRGAGGAVYRATRKSDGLEVAIKRVYAGLGTAGVDHTALREIKVMGECHHENVLGLVDVFVKDDKIMLVMELMATDLFKVIQDRRFPLTLSYVKNYARQALRGLAYLHARWVSHRDLKPANLLLDASGRLVIGDLGMSRVWGFADETLSPAVVTRQYRAPELLFGAMLYDGSAVDMWAMGCIVAELFNRTMLLPGTSDIDQLARIFALRGSPDETSWPDCHLLPDHVRFEPVAVVPPLAEVVPGAPPACIAMLDRMLQLDPRQRLSAQDALNSSFWTDKPAPVDNDKLIPNNVLKKK